MYVDDCWIRIAQSYKEKNLKSVWNITYIIVWNSVPWFSIIGQCEYILDFSKWYPKSIKHFEFIGQNFEEKFV